MALASDLPATRPSRVTLKVKDQPELPEGEELSAVDVVVSPDYLRTAGIPLLRGRSFTEMDNAAAPRVVLVNQQFVHSDLQDQEPLGRRIRLDVGGIDPVWSEIVGVVGNVKWYSQMTREDPEVYEALLQRPVTSFSILIRTSSEPSRLASPVRSAVGEVDADLPVASVMTMPDVIEGQKSGNVFLVRMLSGFAILALILAAIGIYGLVAYSVG